MARRRLDAELVRRGLAASRRQAQVAVREGLVLVGGRPAEKSSTLVDPADPVELVASPRRFVSRGGEKLDAALERFGIAVAGRGCLDAGASTGGFTDCLLRRGAAHVVAVDVGYGQLAWSLRSDARVTVLERTNARTLTRDDLPFAPEIVVADLSFIGLALVVPALAAVAVEDATFVLLVKPQFEVGRERVGEGGVVRDPDAWADAIRSVATASARAGLAALSVMASPVPGPAGNVEFPLALVQAAQHAAVDLDVAIADAVREGLEVAGVSA